MHDYEEVDPFTEFDGCADDIDVPELSEDTYAELRRRSRVSDGTLQRIFDDVLGPADTSTPPALADHSGGEGAWASSPLGGMSWRYNHSAETADAANANVKAWLEEAAAAAADRCVDAMTFGREQMTTIVVQVKHAPLTRDALALGAASALRARIDAMPIVDAVRWALDSLYDSIGDPPHRLPSCPVDHGGYLPTAGEVLTRPGGEHSETPSGSVSPNPPGAPNAVSAPASDDARTAADLFAYTPKEAPEHNFVPDKLFPGSLARSMWTYPVTDVDVVVSLQKPLFQPEPEPEPDLDDASTEAVDQLRRPIRDLARAMNGFSRTHRASTGKVFAGDPNSGDESVVVLTGDLRPS